MREITFLSARDTSDGIGELINSLRTILADSRNLRDCRFIDALVFSINRSIPSSNPRNRSHNLQWSVCGHM